MRGFAAITLKMRKGLRQKDAKAIAEEWQKMFPGGKKSMPITSIENETAFAEIHVKCPLRGTGDVHACHKMMEYDSFVL